MHIIIENYLFLNWEKTKKRQMTKNVGRLILVGCTVLFTLFLGQKVDKFLSILGALSCTPVAFIFPASFHLKVCAKTFIDKLIDITILVFAVCVMVYCTI